MAERSEYVLIEDEGNSKIIVAQRTYAMTVFSRGALVERYVPVAEFAIYTTMAAARDVAMRKIREMTQRAQQARGGESNPM